MGLLIGLPLAIIALNRVRTMFGGEDPIAGSMASVPDSGWYHELITREGARLAGWSSPRRRGSRTNFGRTAADSIAWHADYLDSYLYNPLWWFNPDGGGLGRLGAALMARSELTKMHFDDLTSTAQIRTMWRRYLGGTVAALVWAAERDDVDAARNAIGTGLHAMQDFYSHSSWVDEGGRRQQTWFDAGVPTMRPIRPVHRPIRDLPTWPSPKPVSTLPFDRLDLLPRPDGRLDVILGVLDPDPRPSWSLFTGMYEVPLQHGFRSHGKYAFDCTFYNALPRGLRDPACEVLSIVGMDEVVNQWRSCTGATAAPATPATLAGVPAPPGVLVLAPSGIALDNHWMAGISRGNRPVDDPNLTGDDLFTTARRLATTTTRQWLTELDRIGTTSLELLNPGFWDRVKRQPRQSVGSMSAMAPNPSSPADIKQFEDPAQQPFRIITAGRYPPDPAETTDGWWLRVALGTSTAPLSGTNAEIVLHCEGQEFLLDHGRLRSADGAWHENRLLEWDDFEAGSRAAYIVGPFASLPTEITLENRAASVGTILQAAWDDVTAAFTALGEALGDVFLSLVGGHADLVGDGQAAWAWTDLARVAGQGYPHQVVINVDGGPEGHYTLALDMYASWSGDSIFCQVAYRTLTCVRESTWDRFSTDDEPFVLTLVSNPATGQRFPQLLGPYSGVDSGEFRTTSGSVSTFTVVPRGGGLIVAIQVLESDDETAGDRQDLLDAFATPPQDPTSAPRGAFLDALGTAQAPDWRIADIEVFAFRRNAVVEAGTVIQRQTVGAWLEAGKRRSFPFWHPPRTTIPLKVS